MSNGSAFRRVLAIALILALAFSFAGAGLARAANASPDTATPLDVSTNSISTTLVGSTGGAYQYYRVNYQGGSAPVNFTLTYQPGFGTGNGAFGFNLYGPSGLSFAGQVTNTTSNSATAQYTLVNGGAMSLLVQVYNYTNGGSVNYTLTISGLSGGSSSIVSTQSNTTPNQAASVNTANAVLGGTLVGTAAGTFKYYNLQYPGGNAPLTITENVSPVYTGSNQALGFDVFRTLPNGTASRVSGSSLLAQDANTNSSTYTATITQRSAATYQLQVFNYWPGQSVNYGIQITGLAGPALAVSGNLDAAHAAVLNSAQPGATASLSGSRGGAFQYYLVRYPGSNSAFALSITYSSPGGAPGSALGFKVYDGSTLVTTINPIDDGNGVLSGVWTYSDPNVHTFGVQVFNYQSGATADYVLYESGAQ